MPERKQYFGRWTPAPRPDWVARVNAEGEHIDARAIIPLDEDSLIAWARRNTGLEDFGTDEWREPLRIFLKSVEEEGNLNLMGRLWVRMEVLNLLEARLGIEDAYRQHPEIEDEVIEKPFAIVGQGRSGTTALLNLLARDPRVAAFRQWESMYPVPAPEAATYATDPRILKAENITRMQDRITPEFADMHIIGGDAPRECNRIQALTFLTPWMAIVGQCPTFMRWVAGQDTTSAYVYQKRVMKLLQWKNPRERWVTKNPMDLDRLPELFSVFPDACVIWPHRDPLRAAASAISMGGTWQWQRSDHPFADPEAWAWLTNPAASAARMERVIGWLEDGVIPKEQVLNIDYKSLVRDQIGMAETIYTHFGWSLPESARTALQAYLDAHPRDDRPPHKYPLGSPEEVAQGREALRRYQDYFKVTSE